MTMAEAPQVEVVEEATKPRRGNGTRSHSVELLLAGGGPPVAVRTASAPVHARVLQRADEIELAEMGLPDVGLIELEEPGPPRIGFTPGLDSMHTLAVARRASDMHADDGVERDAAAKVVVDAAELQNTSSGQRFVGAAHRNLALHPRSLRAVKHIKTFVQKNPNQPWMVQFHDSLSQARTESWIFTNSPPHVVGPSGWLAFVSIRFLEPATEDVELILVGEHAVKHATERRQAIFLLLREALLEALGDDVPEGGKVELYLARGSNRVTRYQMVKGFVKVSPVRVGDSLFLLGAITTSVLLTLALASLALYATVSFAFPYIIHKQEEEDFTTAMSHRMTSYVRDKKQPWRLVVFQEYRPFYGVICTFTRRPGHKSFAHFSVELEAKRLVPHLVKMHMPVSDVSTYASNKNILRIMIPVAGTDTREGLYVHNYYRVRVSALNEAGRVVEQSAWSHPICIFPLRPFAMLPFVFFKVFGPSSNLSLTCFWKRMLTPVSPATMEARIHNVVLADINSGTEGQYYLECYVGHEPDMKQTGVKYSRSPEFSIQADGAGQLPDAICFGSTRSRSLYRKNSVAPSDVTRPKGSVKERPEWKIDLQRTTEQRLSIAIFDRALGARIADDAISFDSLFQDSYYHGGSSKIILSDRDEKPLATVYFKCDFGDKAATSTARESVFIGDFENRTVIEGTEMIVLWNPSHHTLLQPGGQPVDRVRLSLHSGDSELCSIGDLRNTGSTLWVVSFGGESPDRANFVLEVDGQEVARSLDLLCQKSLLLADLEMAYASFCRMNDVPMRRITADSIQALCGGTTSMQAVKLAEGMRKPLPFEDEFAHAGRILSPGKIMCSCAAADDPPGHLRTHPVVTNMQISPSPDIWRRDVLLSFRMDFSPDIAHVLTTKVFPVLGKGYVDRLGVRYCGAHWPAYRAILDQLLLELIRYALYTVAYVFQACCFLVPAACGMCLILWKALLDHQCAINVEGPAVDPSEALRGIPHTFSSLPSYSQFAYMLLSCEALMLGSCMLYHNILEAHFPGMQRIVDRTFTALAVIGLIEVSVLIAGCVVWIVLACIISPVLVGYFFMLAGFALVMRSLVGGVSEIRDMVMRVLMMKVPTCLKAMLRRALERVPHESELAKKVREQERVDLREAYEAMLGKYNFQAGQFDEVWGQLGLSVEKEEQDDEANDTGGFSPEMSEMLRTLFYAELNNLPKVEVDPQELAPKKLSQTLGTAIHGLVQRMRRMQGEFLEQLVSERQEQVLHIYHDTVATLADQERIFMRMAAVINDVIANSIDSSLSLLLSPLVPDSEFSKLHVAVRKASLSQKSAQDPRDVLTEMDAITVKNEVPRLHKAEIPEFFIKVGLFEGVEHSAYQLTDRMELLDHRNDPMTITTTVRLTLPMMRAIQDVLDSLEFQSMSRRANVFLTPAEVLKLFGMLTDDVVWWKAFLRMTEELELLPGLPKLERVQRIREAFDHWSDGCGLLPSNQMVNAMLQLTGGGVWLKAMQQLLTQMDLCGVYASGEQFSELSYPGFAKAWARHAGGRGYVEKSMIQEFIVDIITDEKHNVRGIWYEAFIVALGRLRMTLKESTMFSLFKEVDDDNSGFLAASEFSDLVMSICGRGIWQSAYREFLEQASIDLPDEVRDKFWSYLNEGETNPGLVPMEKLTKELEVMVWTSGVLPSVLIAVCSSTGVGASETELRSLHATYDTQAKGFMPPEDLLRCFEEIGRRGLSYSSFRSTVATMGFQIEEDDLYEIFTAVDVNQNDLLAWKDFRGALHMLVNERLPKTILARIEMSDSDVLKRVLVCAAGMLCAFAYVLCALNSFGGGKMVLATVQSSFATGITAFAKSEGSGGLNLDKYKVAVASIIPTVLGISGLVDSEE